MKTLEELETIARAATRGPWRWGGHDTSWGGIHLQSMVSGCPIVMGFQRRGMNSAEPVFWERFEKGDPGWGPAKCQPARDIAVLEVPYRKDVVALKNPDATHIATFDPDTALALIEEIKNLRKAQNVVGN